MPKYIIISENPALANSFRVRLLETGSLEPERVIVRQVSTPPDNANVAREFEELTDWLEAEISSETDGWAVPAVTVFTDLGGYGLDSAAWSSPLMGGGWAQVLGLLILVFPEVHWVFLLEQRIWPALRGDWDELQCFHTVSAMQKITRRGTGDHGSDEAEVAAESGLKRMVGLRDAGFCSLFDPAGLRNTIRRHLREGSSGAAGSEVLGIPLREETAAAVDDEAGYAFLHAYGAYRFGFRSQVVITYAMMKQLFQAGSSFRPGLVMEDIFLNFPDEHPIEFSDIQRRANADLCPGLDAVPRRVLVSIGLGSMHREANKLFVARAQQRGLRYRIRHKPLAGIFNLWEAVGMVHRGSRRPQRTGRGFIWPPHDSARSSGTQVPAHSAPGRLLRVAERLLRRAERMRDKVRSPMAAVYGAVLALDALELLADRTPTTGIQALALKHYFEVKAECQFSGVQHHLSVKPRLIEIEMESQAVSRWFGHNQRSLASLNAEMQIVNTLVRLFRDNTQFDEERMCMVRGRRLHNSIWVQQEAWRICLLPVLRYSELLLARITNFFWAVVVWALLFTATFSGISRMSTMQARDNGASIDILGHTLSSIIGKTLLGPPSLLWQLTTAAAVIVGMAHVGLLTSNLNSIVARK